MRLGLLLGTAALIAATPTVALLLLLPGAGGAAPGRVAIALAAVWLAAVLLALLWVRDMARLAEAVRHALNENHPALGHAASAARLAPVQRIARAIERLARTLAARAEQVAQGLRATETIIDRLPDPLLVLGPGHAVRRANAAARAAFGGDIQAVLRHPGLRAALDRAQARCSGETAELSLSAPVPREVRAAVLMLDPPLADGGQVIVVLSDRTRERAVERMRADFVANVSHELRTPLASLIGFIETLRGPAADDRPAQQRFLGIMAEQAARMNRLIDDLLSLSRIELIEHQPPTGRVDAAALAARIVAAFEPRGHVELAAEPGLPMLVADADQIEQVLQNLVDNALKYGRRDGRVRLGLARAAPGQGPGRLGVVLSVADDGPGIARAHLPRLTERFYRIDKGRSRSAGGTGLGLAIVKHIVSRHRGRLAIDSEEGKGTTFSVWLPAAEEDATGAARG